jgi:hypothetical protein
MFSFFTQRSHYFPAAPLVCLAGIMGAGSSIAASLEVPEHTDHHDGVKESSNAQHDGEQALLLNDSEAASPVPVVFTSAAPSC